MTPNTCKLSRVLTIMGAILLLPAIVSAKTLYIGSISDDPGLELCFSQPKTAMETSLSGNH